VGSRFKSEGVHQEGSETLASFRAFRRRAPSRLQRRARELADLEPLVGRRLEAHECPPNGLWRTTTKLHSVCCIVLSASPRGSLGGLETRGASGAGSMRLNKRMGPVASVAFLLVLAASGPAHAAPTNLTIPASDMSGLIASDPGSEYVSIAEAKREFGFDPAVEELEPLVTPEPEVTPLWSWWGCDWRGVADYPHKTNGEAAVHGYWVRDGGDCPSTGTVTAQLQALACSSLYGCTWITQSTHTVKGVKPGSGTGHWATPHKRCASSSTVGWRGRVDTALTAFYDPFGWDYGAQKDLACSPA
jgi:hypothetical protein